MARAEKRMILTELHEKVRRFCSQARFLESLEAVRSVLHGNSLYPDEIRDTVREFAETVRREKMCTVSWPDDCARS